MKRTLFLVLCAALSMAISVPSLQAGSSPNGKPFVSIDGKIVEVVNASVSSIEEKIDALTGRVDTLEARVTVIEEAIAGLKDQNIALGVLIASNVSDIVEIDDLVYNLQLDNQILKDQIAAIPSQDNSALQEQIDLNAAQIASLQSAKLMTETQIISLDESLQAQIDSNLALIVGLQSQIDQISDDLDLKQKLLNGKCPDGSAINGFDEYGGFSCGLAGGASGTLQAQYKWQRIVAAPGQYAGIRAYCDEGYSITGAGFASAAGWTVHDVYTEIDVAKNTQSTIVRATNNSDDSVNGRDIYAIATCFKIN